MKGWVNADHIGGHWFSCTAYRKREREKKENYIKPEDTTRTEAQLCASHRFMDDR